jgi:hypothetical protein
MARYSAGAARARRAQGLEPRRTAPAPVGQRGGVGAPAPSKSFRLSRISPIGVRRGIRGIERHRLAERRQRLVDLAFSQLDRPNSRYRNGLSGELVIAVR